MLNGIYIYVMIYAYTYGCIPWGVIKQQQSHWSTSFYAYIPSGTETLQ